MTITITQGISKPNGITGTLTGISNAGGISAQGGGPTPPEPGFWELFFNGRVGSVFSSEHGSEFYEDSAQTTPCTVSGTSPVGAIVDLSGNVDDPSQTTTGNKGVFYVDGAGIKSVRIGTISGVSRVLDFAQAKLPAAVTIFCVYKHYTGPSSSAAPYTNFNSGWPSPIGAILTNNTSDVYLYPSAAISGPSRDGAAGYFSVVRTGTGTNETTVRAAGTVLGTPVSAVQTNNTVDETNIWRMGMLGYNSDNPCEIAFMLIMHGAATTDEYNEILAEVQTKYGAW